MEPKPFAQYLYEDGQAMVVYGLSRRGESVHSMTAILWYSHDGRYPLSHVTSAGIVAQLYGIDLMGCVK